MDIKEARKRLGLTQAALAQKLGVTELTVRRWEKSQHKPSPMAQRLIDKFLKRVKQNE